MSKIPIVGAGPGGLAAAIELGKEAVVHEEHRVIGEPVQCTGLVSTRIDSLLKLPSNLIINKVKGAKLVSASGKEFVLSRGRIEAYVLDRAGLDRHLATVAESRGATIKLRSRVDAVKLSKAIVGDGPLSETRRQLAPGRFDYLPALQYVVEADFDPDMVELHFLFKDFFLWVVPEDKRHARVGLAAKTGWKEITNKFLKIHYPKHKICCVQGGIVVTNGPIPKTALGGRLLVGDAAGQVKATTGGGIITSIICGRLAAKNIHEPAAYEREWRKAAGAELTMAKRLRDFLSWLPLKTYDDIFTIASRNQDLIEKHGDMDFHSKLVVELLKRPTNILYGGKALLSSIF